MDYSYLADLSHQDFERERCRLIGEALDAVPKERRVELHLYQFKLDAMRDKLSQEEFMIALAGEMIENMENLVDQFAAIKNTLSGPPKH